MQRLDSRQRNTSHGCVYPHDQMFPDPYSIRKQDFTNNFRRRRRSDLKADYPQTCRWCHSITIRQGLRDARKAAALDLEEGSELENTPLDPEITFPEILDVDMRWWLHDADPDVQALWSMGLVYEDEQDRGAGFGLNLISHTADDFAISYKPASATRRQQRSPGAGTFSPAMSFVDITSDEELAAFLSVHDYVDLGGSQSEGEGFEMI